MKNAVFLIVVLGAAALQAQVTYEELLRAPDEPQNWLTYSGRYSGWRYSKLGEINTSNAQHLGMQWAFQVGDLGQFETTPLVVDGVLYGTGQNDRAFAVDARTGRAIWRYQRSLPEKLQPCCGMVNRGFAILGTAFSWRRSTRMRRRCGRPRSPTASSSPSPISFPTRTMR